MFFSATLLGPFFFGIYSFSMLIPLKDKNGLMGTYRHGRRYWYGFRSFIPDAARSFSTCYFHYQARDKELARTPLHFASRSGGLETTLVLLNNGADFNAKTGEIALSCPCLCSSLVLPLLRIEFPQQPGRLNYGLNLVKRRCRGLLIKFPHQPGRQNYGQPGETPFRGGLL